jgi:hypothetical protein
MNSNLFDVVTDSIGKDGGIKFGQANEYSPK